MEKMDLLSRCTGIASSPAKHAIATPHLIWEFLVLFVKYPACGRLNVD